MNTYSPFYNFLLISRELVNLKTKKLDLPEIFSVIEVPGRGVAHQFSTILGLRDYAVLPESKVLLCFFYLPWLELLSVYLKGNGISLVFTTFRFNRFLWKLSGKLADNSYFSKSSKELYYLIMLSKSTGLSRL